MGYVGAQRNSSDALVEKAETDYGHSGIRAVGLKIEPTR
jgi:hypothetical protein